LHTELHLQPWRYRSGQPNLIDHQQCTYQPRLPQPSGNRSCSRYRSGGCTHPNAEPICNVVTGPDDHRHGRRDDAPTRIVRDTIPSSRMRCPHPIRLKTNNRTRPTVAMAPVSACAMWSGARLYSTEHRASFERNRACLWACSRGGQFWAPDQISQRCLRSHTAAVTSPAEQTSPAAMLGRFSELHSGLS